MYGKGVNPITNPTPNLTQHLYPPRACALLQLVDRRVESQPVGRHGAVRARGATGQLFFNLRVGGERVSRTWEGWVEGGVVWMVLFWAGSGREVAAWDALPSGQASASQRVAPAQHRGVRVGVGL